MIFRKKKLFSNACLLILYFNANKSFTCIHQVINDNLLYHLFVVYTN